MFREMRRKKQALSTQDCCDILERGISGVLALADSEDYPYAVPLNFVYDGERLLFHCAKAGQKLDMLQRNSKASFCVIDQDEIVPEEYTTYFRSVIVFGTIQMLDNELEKRSAIEKLVAKYAPESSEDARKNAIDRDYAPMCMLEMRIEHMTGKEAIELVRQHHPK